MRQENLSPVLLVAVMAPDRDITVGRTYTGRRRNLLGEAFGYVDVIDDSGAEHTYAASFFRPHPDSSPSSRPSCYGRPEFALDAKQTEMCPRCCGAGFVRVRSVGEAPER
jgi:hypothetical protein